jgi:hypothetical protein
MCMRGPRSGWSGYGWYRIDPTAALAPDRVNIDLRSWLAGGAEAAERQRRSLWGRTTQRMRLLWDSLNYAWQDRVIDYNQEVPARICWSVSACGKAGCCC